MKKTFTINFAEVEEGSVHIKNQSTACIIKITVDSGEEGKQELFLYYHELEDLIKALDNISE